MFPLIRLFPQDSKIDFLGLRRITLVLSLVLPLIFSSSPRGHGQTLLRRTPELT